MRSPDDDRVASLPPGGADASRPGHPRQILAATILASSLAFVDGSVVNVGLPAIGRTFAATGGSLSWVVTGYLLPLSALLLIGGAAGDLYGRRRMLLAGTVLFAVASMICAAAPRLEWLLAGRVLQGAGAAMLMPNSLAVLGSSFSGEARGRAIGTWAAVGAAAGAIGPLLGGWLIDVVGWRAIFLINAPIAAGALFLTARYVDPQQALQRSRLDVAGAALATAWLATLTWALTAMAGPDGPNGPAWLVLGGSAICLVLFLVTERRRGDRAMMPLELFASRRFVGLTVLTFLLYGALGGLLILVPYVLIEACGYSATAAGSALLPLPLVIALVSSPMGTIASRVGARLPLMIGPTIVAGGFLLATRIGGAGSYWTTTLPALLVLSFGMAVAVAPLTTAVLSSVDPQHTGLASGLNSAVARAGGLIATALLGFTLALHGEALVRGFQRTALVLGAAALASGASAFIWLKKEELSRVDHS